MSGDICGGRGSERERGSVRGKRKGEGGREREGEGKCGKEGER